MVHFFLSAGQLFPQGCDGPLFLRLDGGNLAVKMVPETFILICSAHGCVSLAILTAVSMAVMRSIMTCRQSILSGSIELSISFSFLFSQHFSLTMCLYSSLHLIISYY